MISLLRHGEVEGAGRLWGRTDVALTDLGWQQMEHAVVADSSHWQRVVSSPLSRCAAFASAFARRNQLPYREEPRLVELDFGDWEGSDPAQLHRRDPLRLGRLWSDPENNAAPNGETGAALLQRVEAAWGELIADPTPCLLVTHGGVIRAVMALLEGLTLKQALGREVPYACRLEYRAEAGRLS